MARRKAVEEDTPTSFTGRINIAQFDEAAAQVVEDRQVTTEEIHEILRKSIDKAVRDTLYPNSKTGSAKDMHSETDIDFGTGEITFYQCQDVMKDEDITDDLYQISVEDAQAHDPSLKEGDVYKEKIDLTKLDYSFVIRAIQYFMNGLRAASKQALVKLYSNRIGQIITGTVETNEGRYTTLSFNKVNATLIPQQSIPGEEFAPGERVKVLLKDIGNTDNTNSKAPQLIISRTDPKFLVRLFEQEIPDIADGSVQIKGCVREPGIRAKVSVWSDNPNVDPTGACIGSDGQRIKDICAQIHNEKIDVIKYYANRYLYVAEALKPATVVGVEFLEDQPVEENKMPKAIAVVKNEESKIAIGKKGVNVRLASRLTGYSIDIKELDAAMAEHITYENIDKIRRDEALKNLSDELANAPEDEETVLPDEETVTPDTNEAEAPAVQNTEAPVAEETPVSEAKPNEEPVKEEEKPAAAEAPVNEAKTEEKPVTEAKPIEPKKEEEPVEHIEIKNKARISLDKLEAEIEAEKKKKSVSSSYPHFKKNNNKKDEDKDEDEKKSNVQNAMPIYTEEEIKEMDEEDSEQQNNDNADDEDYSEYDSDSYYEDK